MEESPHVRYNVGFLPYKVIKCNILRYDESIIFTMFIYALIMIIFLLILTISLKLINFMSDELNLVQKTSDVQRRFCA